MSKVPEMTELKHNVQSELKCTKMPKILVDWIPNVQ